MLDPRTQIIINTTEFPYWRLRHHLHTYHMSNRYPNYRIGGSKEYRPQAASEYRSQAAPDLCQTVDRRQGRNGRLTDLDSCVVLARCVNQIPSSGNSIIFTNWVLNNVKHLSLRWCACVPWHLFPPPHPMFAWTDPREWSWVIAATYMHESFKPGAKTNDQQMDL